RAGARRRRRHQRGAGTGRARARGGRVRGCGDRGCPGLRPDRGDETMSGRQGRTVARVVWGWAVLALVALSAPTRVAGQDLANFDYENLSFRGLGLEIGYLFPDRIENAPTYGVRFDLGYLGPGLRIVPTFTYWSAPFEASEVMGLEERVASLVSRETGAPPPLVDLGTMRWT